MNESNFYNKLRINELRFEDFPKYFPKSEAP